MSLSNTVAAAPVESSKAAVSWGPIIAGAFAAIGITIVLITFGSGVGLTMVSPWSGQSSSAATIGFTAAIWFVVVQWLSSALGGYITGRLRTKWASVHTNEVFFRDTAHGFVMWSLATVVTVGFLASSLTSLAGAGASAIGTVTSAAGVAGAAAASNSPSSGSDLSTSYFTDALLRPDAGKARPVGDDAAASGEVSRILLNGVAQGQISDDDKNYLATIVSSKAGVPQDQAKARVDTVLKQIDDAKNATKAAADKARKAAATTALLGSLSLIIGAFIAAAAAALGGIQRDEEEDLVALRR